MTRRRSFVGLGVLYAALAALLVVLDSPVELSAETLLQLLPLAAGMVYVDRWVNWVAPQVQWSYGSVIAIAAMVIAPRGQAAAVGAILGALGALTDQEFVEPDLGRIAVNAGQLGIAGWAGGFVLDLLRADTVGPSVQLVLAALAAVPVITVVSGLLVTVAIRYGYGAQEQSSMVLAAGLLGWRKIVAAVAAAAIASTVSVVGSAWILIALVQIAALGAIPIVRARLEARRRDIMQAVTSALNAWGVVGSAHDQLEKTAVTLGHRFGLNSDQIEQVRYVSLLYSMTDHFAIALPRSFEDQLRGLDEDAFSSALLLGLPLSDVADPAVVRIAETAAEYEALVRPVDGAEPLKPNEAAAELLRAGSNPAIVAALLDERPLPDSYLRAWEIDPASLWQKPMRWMADHAL